MECIEKTAYLPMTYCLAACMQRPQRERLTEHLNSGFSTTRCGLAEPRNGDIGTARAHIAYCECT